MAKWFSERSRWARHRNRERRREWPSVKTSLCPISWTSVRPTEFRRRTSEWSRWARRRNRERRREWPSVRTSLCPISWTSARPTKFRRKSGERSRWGGAETERNGGSDQVLRPPFARSLGQTPDPPSSAASLAQSAEVTVKTALRLAWPDSTQVAKGINVKSPRCDWYGARQNEPPLRAERVCCALLWKTAGPRPAPSRPWVYHCEDTQRVVAWVRRAGLQNVL